MKKTTDEFSFILKPSRHGVGVFAAHAIKKGTFLRLFGDERVLENKTRILKIKEVPKILQGYCIFRPKKLLIGPLDFGNMSVGWYLNHSKKPNAYHKDYNYYAARDLKAGEEILIDYNTLEEPEDDKDSYYKK